MVNLKNRQNSRPYRHLQDSMNNSTNLAPRKTQKKLFKILLSQDLASDSKILGTNFAIFTSD